MINQDFVLKAALSLLPKNINIFFFHIAMAEAIRFEISETILTFRVRIPVGYVALSAYFIFEPSLKIILLILIIYLI